MAKKEDQRTVYVYADWRGLRGPVLIGPLKSMQARKEVFSFEYDEVWLKTYAQTLDPDLQLFGGPQYLNAEKSNFGLFMDSSPDRWGRALMDRREAIHARLDGRRPRMLWATDYLLGVFDGHRMGALRFKEDPEGPFLNNNKDMASPPWTSIRELEHASLELEKEGDDENRLKWLNMLINPGSSLGGARPKASVVDTKGELWIAKFPSLKDSIDVGAWEMVVRELGHEVGVNFPICQTGKFHSSQHTFLTKRFDREGSDRIHFASAMTLLGYTDGKGYKDGVSYLELAEFIMKNGASVKEDLEELWRRIVFYICVSNADDHLRNHGFLLTEKGWRLSPAYDVNPMIRATGLSLNISETDNSLSLDLAREVAAQYRITTQRAETIIHQVTSVISEWNGVAEKYHIQRSERDLMSECFRVC
jgi:serine/threonine-protein kinase HipA